MARTNKYTSVNFNDIYEKKFSNNPLPNPNNSSPLPNNARTKTIISNSRIQGNMLVLSRPTPKPISLPVPIPQQHQEPTLDSKLKENQESLKLSSNPIDQAGSEVEKISLRPQGRTGSGSSLGHPPLVSPSAVVSPSGSGLRTNKFVPPHLRPGFVGREEKPVVGVQRYGENGRPKSGGGYERMMRGGVDINNERGGGGYVGGGGGGGDVDSAYFMNRPASRGARPNSSG